MNWLVIGVTGVTCSGKSSLAKSIVGAIDNRQIRVPQHITIGSVKLVKQDDYFHPKTSTEHVWIPEFNYINREILNALDMTKLCGDVNDILGSTYQLYDRTRGQCIVNVLVIEGFLLFNCKDIVDKCQIKFDLQLSYDECLKRRSHRKYNPPNPPGYFEKVIWPFYLQHWNEYKSIKDLHTINGQLSEEVVLGRALEQIENYL